MGPTHRIVALAVDDRFIWTVIGDTVNLTARLQSMTRGTSLPGA